MKKLMNMHIELYGHILYCIDNSTIKNKSHLFYIGYFCNSVRKTYVFKYHCERI